MAYKFQLGAAVLSGSIKADDGIVGTDVDQDTADFIVAQIDNGDIPIAKLAESTISGKALGTNLDALAVDDSSIEYSAGSAFNGSAASTIRVKALGVTNAMLAGSIANAKLANSTISGKALGVNLDSLTDGNGISDFTFNGSSNAVISIDLSGSANGLNVTADGLAIKLSGSGDGFIIDAGGLAFNANPDSFSLSPSDGLELAAGVAGDGLALGSGVLSVGVDDSSIETNSDALRVKANGITNDMLAGSIANSKLANQSVTVGTTGINLGASSTTLAGMTGIDFAAGNASIAASIGANTLTIGHASSTIVMAGNLQVDGTLQNRSATEIQIDDLTLQLAQGAADSAAADGAGVKIDGADAFLTWDHANTRMNLNKVLNATSFVGDVAGNATTATTLASARNIGGVSFNGSADINLPGVNQAGNQNTSGTAAIATTVTVADESSDISCNVLFATAATGDLEPKSGTNLTFNSSNGTLTATSFAGDGSSLTGVSATQIAVALKADTESLVAGFNYIADMSSDGTDVFTLPASPAAGDVVYVKAPSDCSEARIAHNSKSWFSNY